MGDAAGQFPPKAIVVVMYAYGPTPCSSSLKDNDAFPSRTAFLRSQDEAFFKGERGQCSERASALKLGERHFHDGHTSCGQGLYLWPLLAYELQLRNEQIDRLRKAFAG